VRSSVTIGFIDAIDYYADRHILRGKLHETSELYNSGIIVRPNYQLTGSAVTYTLDSVPAYREEEYVNSSNNYKSWIAFQMKGLNFPLISRAGTDKTINSYQRLSEHLYDNPYFIGNLETQSISKELWAPLIQRGMTTEQKVTAIYDYIRSNMTSTYAGGFTPQNDNNKIWKNKTGSSTEINILLINTLLQAGIKSYPLLVGSRKGGYINKSFPMFSQFSHIMAYVELDGAKKPMVLDAGNKYLPAGLPPYEQLNTYGLVLKSRTESFWYAIYDQSADNTNVLINAKLDDQGKITGEMTIVHTNYSANKYINLIGKDKESEATDALKENIPNATIESISDTVTNGHTRYIQKVKFSFTPPADNEGYVYISPSQIYGAAANPFASAERLWDIDFGYMPKENIVFDLKIPDSYVIDSMSRSLKVLMPDSSVDFSYMADRAGDNIMMVQKIQYHKSFFKRDDYPFFYDFQQKYFELRQKPVILKRKV
jgi:hypothetical protein